MVLSERERRLLQEMETQLQAEDPRLASSLSLRRLSLRGLGIGAGAALTVAGLAVGILLMVVGIGRAHAVGIAVALVGFVVLLVSTTVSGEWLRARGNRNPFAGRAARRARRAS
jgi:Protein of unknown function (DUF3040)